MELLYISLIVFSIFSSMGIGVWLWERMEYRQIEKYQAMKYRIFRKRYHKKMREYTENAERYYR